MQTSRKIFAAIVAAGIMGAGAAAQAEPGYQGCPMGMMPGPGAMKGAMGDPATRAERHLSYFKSELKLTPQQEPLWLAFAEKVKAKAGQSFKAMQDQAKDASLTAPERMDKMVALMKERVAAMEATHESFKRLYDALTPEQKKVADQHATHMGHRGPKGKPGRGMPPAERNPG